MSRTSHALRTIISHPLTEMITGLILLVSGLSTAYYELADAEQTVRLGVHHGVALWGLVQVLGSLPDLIDGMEKSFTAFEKRQKS